MNEKEQKEKEYQESLIKDFFDIKLHEEIRLDKLTKVIKVPGGWIYKHYSSKPTARYEYADYFDEIAITTFVPDTRVINTNSPDGYNGLH